MKIRPVLLAGAAVLATACNPPEDVEPLACRNEDPGTATLGKGDLNAGFITVEEGDPLAVLFGPQGMHMVVVSVQVENLETSSAGGLGNDVSIGMWQDGEIIGGTKGDLIPVEAAGGLSEFLGLRAVITVAEVETVGNQDAYIEATVVDGCGRELTTGKDLWLAL